MKSEKEKQMSESFALGALLALTGGFLDAYTYISRGGVFANAQTGNIVLMGINISRGDWGKVIHYIVPILAFAVGILLAEAVKSVNKRNRVVHWRQIIILTEAAVLVLCGFIPSGTGDMAVNTLISFVCSLQVESFRTVRGNTAATTMCTGNLRSGTELLFHGVKNRNSEQVVRSLTYYGIILFFVIGAVIGALVTKKYGTQSIFAAAGMLILPFAMMFKKSRFQKRINGER